MSENNHNEADALFATRRKKQQDEEAQRAAQRAEEERLAELERQRQQVQEDIKKLETLQALQKQQAEMEAQKAQAEREALAAQKAQAEAEAQRVRAQAEAEAQRVRAEREALAAQKAKAEQEAKKAREEQQAIALKKAQEERDAIRAQKAAQKAQAEADKEARKALKEESGTETAGKAPFNIKKFLPFIIGGVVVVAAVVVILVLKPFSSDKKEQKGNDQPSSGTQEYEGDYYTALSQELADVDWYRNTDYDKGITYVYPSVFTAGTDDEGDPLYTYYDEYTLQNIEMQIYPFHVTDDNRYDLLDDDHVREVLSNGMFDQGASDFTIDLNNGVYIAAGDLDDIGYGEEMPVIIFGMKGDLALELDIKITREGDGYERYIDIDDLKYMFDVIFGQLTVG